MAFILAPKTESFFYPVTVPVMSDSGAAQLQRFEMRFKRLPRSKLNDLQKLQESRVEQDEDSLERDADYVMEIADGWKEIEAPAGMPLDFTRENVLAVLDSYPAAAGEIVKAFFEATLGGGRKRKN